MSVRLTCMDSQRRTGGSRLPGAAPFLPSWGSTEPNPHLTLFSTAFSLAGGFVTGRLVLTTFTGCCSLPPLLYLLLSNFGLGTPYFLRIFEGQRERVRASISGGEGHPFQGGPRNLPSHRAGLPPQGSRERPPGSADPPGPSWGDGRG